MSDGDIFREVDEAIRQDQLKSLWDKYGLFFLAGAVAIVGGVAGYKGWGHWQAKRAADSGARFVGALQLNEDGKTQEALEAFKEIAEDGTGGYGVLARLRLASAEAKKGEKAAAVKAYDAIAADAATGSILQGLAKIQAATLRLDQADMGEMKQRLEALADGTDPWRHSARELLGLAAHRTGNAKDAERYFTQVLGDRDAPPSLKRRAEMMLALIVKADQPSPGTAAK